MLIVEAFGQAAAANFILLFNECRKSRYLDCELHLEIEQ